MTHEKNAIRTNTQGQKSGDLLAKSFNKICQNELDFTPFDTRLDTLFDTSQLRFSDVLAGRKLTEFSAIRYVGNPLLDDVKNIKSIRTNKSLHISALLSDYLRHLYKQPLRDTNLPVNPTASPSGGRGATGGLVASVVTSGFATSPNIVVKVLPVPAIRSLARPEGCIFR